MSKLDSISTGVKRKPPRILLYGIEGIGKSTFASNFPAPIFVQTEDGLDNINCSSFPLSKSFDEVIEDLDELVVYDHEFKTVVIDSLDWLERLVWDKVCVENKVSSIEGIGYGRGYVIALTYWKKIVELLDRLRNEKKMIVLLLAHAVSEDYSDAEVAQLKRFTPRLHKSARSLFAEYVDLMLLATRRFGAVKGTGERIVKTEAAPQQVAKSRYRIPPVLPLDANAVLGAIRQSIVGETS